MRGGSSSVCAYYKIGEGIGFTRQQVRLMMKGHSFSRVTRSRGEYEGLSRDDEEEVICDIGVKVGLSTRQRRSVITDSDQTRFKKNNCIKRFREEVQALVPAINVSYA